MARTNTIGTISRSFTSFSATLLARPLRWVEHGLTNHEARSPSRMLCARNPAVQLDVSMLTRLTRTK
jgi:hypothetical protein